MANGPPGGTRWVDVAPARLTAWLESFAERHGGLAQPPEPGPADGQPAGSGAAAVTFRAADGAAARCHVPFPPLAAAIPAAAPAGMAEPAASAAAMAAHATADRTVG